MLSTTVCVLGLLPAATDAAPGMTGAHTRPSPTATVEPHEAANLPARWFPGPLPSPGERTPVQFNAEDREYVLLVRLLAQTIVALAPSSGRVEWTAGGRTQGAQRWIATPEQLRVELYDAHDPRAPRVHQRAWGGVQVWTGKDDGAPADLLPAGTPIDANALTTAWTDVDLLDRALTSLVSLGPPLPVDAAQANIHGRTHLIWPLADGQLQVTVDTHRGGVPIDWTRTRSEPGMPNAPARVRYRFDGWRDRPAGIRHPTSITRMAQSAAAAASMERISWSDVQTTMPVEAAFKPPPGYEGVQAQQWIDVILPANVEERRQVAERLAEISLEPGERRGAERWTVRRMDPAALAPWRLKRHDAILGLSRPLQREFRSIATADEHVVEDLVQAVQTATTREPVGIRVGTHEGDLVELVAWTPPDQSETPAEFRARIRGVYQYPPLPYEDSVAYAERILAATEGLIRE